MAERRMFSKKIVYSDAFLDMPQSSQNLYFHLSMRADDDGFINNPKKIMRMTGASEDDMRILIGKRFLIGFESGVVVIKHWHIHNYIQKDRKKPTLYIDEMAQLAVNDNGSYTECKSNVYKLDTTCTPSIGKDRLGKDSVDVSKPKKPTRQEYGSYSNILLSDQDYLKLSEELTNLNDLIEKMSTWCKANGKTYKDYAAALRNWAKREPVDKPKKKQDDPWINF